MFTLLILGSSHSMAHNTFTQRLNRTTTIHHSSNLMRIVCVAASARTLCIYTATDSIFHVPSEIRCAHNQFNALSLYIQIIGNVFSAFLILFLIFVVHAHAVRLNLGRFTLCTLHCAVCCVHYAIQNIFIALTRVNDEQFPLSFYR